MWFHLAIAAVALFTFLYILYIGVSAFLDTKSAPRKPMAWCQKHGAILEEYMIDFLGQKVCAICFHDKMKAAEHAGQTK